MSQLWVLFVEFFKVGLFSVGGGLATLPFLYRLADQYPWLTMEMIPNMIAVSESTPGPLGVNMATYAGFQAFGVWGGIVATTGLVLPSVIIIIWVSNFLTKFRENKYVTYVFYLLRPAVTGLIAVAGFSIIRISLFSAEQWMGGFIANVRWFECGIFALMIILTNKVEKHPIVYIAMGALIGVVFRL